MKQILATAIAVFALAGCGAEGEAKKAVKGLLNDPDSAQFSDLESGQQKGDVCGYVNAKNRMGGYVGKTPFFYAGSTQTAAIVKAPEESDFRQLWLTIEIGRDFSEQLYEVTTKCNLMKKWDEVCATSHPQSWPKLCSAIVSGNINIYQALKAEFER